MANTIKKAVTFNGFSRINGIFACQIWLNNSEPDVKGLAFIAPQRLIEAMKQRECPVTDDDVFIADGMNSFERNTKRIGDMIIAMCCLVLFSPLFLICYIAVRREDGGAVIFKQERIGRFGRPFYIYKFRSMCMDAETKGPELFKHGMDKRLTNVGRFLREHHLDELPQLWNVFCGDMSFVGPRPERKFYIDKIMEHDKRYTYLYQIRPGVTSYATIYNGYTDTLEKMLRRLRLDLFYLKHRSWLFDAEIMFVTCANVFFGKKF